MQIETERLLLRPLKEEDLAAFARMNADPEVMRYFPFVLSAEESKQRLEASMAAMEARGWGCWAVEQKGIHPFIGFIALNDVPFESHFTPRVEIAWRLGREHWGQGLAPEGARAALDFAFASLALPEVVAFTVVGNLQSRRVMEKIGMVRDLEGDFRHPKVPKDHPLSLCVLYRATSGRALPAE